MQIRQYQPPVLRLNCQQKVFSLVKLSSKLSPWTLRKNFWQQRPKIFRKKSNNIVFWHCYPKIPSNKWTAFSKTTAFLLRPKSTLLSFAAAECSSHVKKNSNGTKRHNFRLNTKKISKFFLNFPRERASLQIFYAGMTTPGEIFWSNSTENYFFKICFLLAKIFLTQHIQTTAQLKIVWWKSERNLATFLFLIVLPNYNPRKKRIYSWQNLLTTLSLKWYIFHEIFPSISQLEVSHAVFTTPPDSFSTNFQKYCMNFSESLAQTVSVD